jgi:hypothetical protein
MEEVLAHFEQVPHWQAVAAGRPAAWDDVFAGYRAQVDWCSTSPKADAALRFLDVPVPEVPFPRANSTEQFWHLVRGEPH